MTYHCGKEIEPRIEKQIFSDGSQHLASFCPICNRFLQYVSQGIDYRNFIMPFGKYKGEKIIDIDQKYLWWLLENNVVKGSLKKCIEQIFIPNL